MAGLIIPVIPRTVFTYGALGAVSGSLEVPLGMPQYDVTNAREVQLIIRVHTTVSVTGTGTGVDVRVRAVAPTPLEPAIDFVYATAGGSPIDLVTRVLSSAVQGNSFVDPVNIAGTTIGQFGPLLRVLMHVTPPTTGTGTASITMSADLCLKS